MVVQPSGELLMHLLVARGAHLEASDNNGQTLLDLATSANAHDVAEALLLAGPNGTSHDKTRALRSIVLHLFVTSFVLTACRQGTSPKSAATVSAQPETASSFEFGNPWWKNKRIPMSTDDPEEACDGGDGRACYIFGSHFEDEGDFGQARLQYSRACERGMAPGCYNSGVLAQNGQGGPPDYNAALTWHRKACAQGVIEACTEIGFMQERGQGMLPDRAAALRVYGQACKLGAGRACNNLAHLERTGSRPNPNRVQEFYRKACDLSYVKACARLGSYVAQGCTRGQARCDEARRRGLRDDDVQKAEAAELQGECIKFHSPHACVALAVLLEEGLHYVPDPDRALKLSTKACEAGLAWGCNNAANLHRRGRGTIPNIDRSIDLYRRACSMGFAMACHDLGALMASDDVHGGFKNAVHFLSMSCDMGQFQGCLELMTACMRGTKEACEVDVAAKAK